MHMHHPNAFHLLHLHFMEEIEKLQVLSVVSRLTAEINNYLGVNDKTLAEFVLDLYDKSGGEISQFKANLERVGGDFPESFIENADRLIKQLHPKYITKPKVEDPKQEEPTPRQFYAGLAIPDSKHIESKEYAHEMEEDLGDLGKSGSVSRNRSPDRYDSKNRSGRWSRSPDYEDRRGRRRSPPWRDDKNGKQRKYNRFSSSIERRELKIDDIYDADITNITDFGAFAALRGIKGNGSKNQGLIHISAFSHNRISHPGDIVRRGERVKVKVVKIEGDRIGLSMKEVDQETGLEITDLVGKSTAVDGKIKSKKRLTSPERWEIRQLIASGVLSSHDYPGLDDDINAAQQDDDNYEAEVDVDVEVEEQEPDFLAGQTKQSLELSPIRVVKAPDGSLNRAAISGATLARERREARIQEAKEKLAKERGENKEKARTQHDPMAVAKSNGTAYDVKEVPEWKRAISATNTSLGPPVKGSIAEQRRNLPVYQLREQIIQAVKDNQVLIVVGDTGSGKTTQITQYLDEAGFTHYGKVGCTQPRQVAAISVAKRVAEEVGCKVGQDVGYHVRFDDSTSPQTRIKYMTDGMLQREALIDPDMNQYSVIMLDEAHERTIATDVLFALLKKAAKRRPDLKLIITSATLDAEKFSQYFSDCPILFIPGRTYPVEIMYTKEPEFDYLDAALMTVLQIHLSEPPGDILLFLTGQEEIDTSCEILYERMKALGDDVPQLLILPVYSALPSEMQSRIFEPAPSGSRKVVIATNIAETSITIDGIYYVVDPGFVKISAYDPKLGMDSLVITPISQAQANQRSGRAGRTGPGKCYRLYTEQAFQNEMLPNSIPEIQRQNLSHTILMLKAMGINDLLHFDFMDPPPSNTMLTALEELYQLSALDNEGLLTRLGRKMADFPMEPAMAKVLIASVDYGCSEEILSVVAMLSIQTIFYRPKDKREQADQKKAKFHDPTGDHLTLLNIYNGYVRARNPKIWCSENFIQERSLKRAMDVRKQLVTIMQRYRHRLASCGNDTNKIRKVLCSGYFRNAAKKDPQEGYKTLYENTPVYLHPSSALQFKAAEYVIYHTLQLTSKEYMQCVTAIDPKWLVETAPTFFKIADPDKARRSKGAKVQPMRSLRKQDHDEWKTSLTKRFPVVESQFN